MPCATTEQGKGAAQTASARQGGMEPQMIILGLVLLVVGILTGISILTTIGVILMVVGATCGSSAPAAAPSADARTTGDGDPSRIAPSPALPVSWREGDSVVSPSARARWPHSRALDAICYRHPAPALGRRRRCGLLDLLRGRGLLTVSDVFFGVVDRSVEGIHDAHGKVARVAIVLRPRHADGRAARFDMVRSPSEGGGSGGTPTEQEQPCLP